MNFIISQLFWSFSEKREKLVDNTCTGNLGLYIIFAPHFILSSTFTVYLLPYPLSLDHSIFFFNRIGRGSTAGRGVRPIWPDPALPAARMTLVSVAGKLRWAWGSPERNCYRHAARATRTCCSRRCDKVAREAERASGVRLAARKVSPAARKAEARGAA